MRYRHLLLIQILLWMFVISLVVHSKCIFTWTGFMANEAIISSVLDVLGLYVLRHVAFYFRAVGTFTTLPHSGRLTRYSIHLGLDQTHKLYHERKRFQTCKFVKGRTHCVTTNMCFNKTDLPITLVHGWIFLILYWQILIIIIGANGQMLVPFVKSFCRNNLLVCCCRCGLCDRNTFHNLIVLLLHARLVEERWRVSRIV